VLRAGWVQSCQPSNPSSGPRRLKIAPVAVHLLPGEKAGKTLRRGKPAVSSPSSASADVPPTLRSARAELKFSATTPTWALIERRYHRGSKFRIPEASQSFFRKFEGAEDGAGFVLAR